MNECCMECKFCKLMADELMCDNEDSDGYGISVSGDDYCEYFEEREE